MCAPCRRAASLHCRRAASISCCRAAPLPSLSPPSPQDALSTLLIEVRELVVARSTVGVVYDVLCGRRGQREPVQLRAVAVFDVGADGTIASSQAVVRVVSGSPADEALATLMPETDT